MAASWLTVRLRLAVLPEGVGWAQLVGVAALTGIGFTVSLFVASLAFDDGGPFEAAAKLGILAASALASLLGVVLLALASRRAGADGAGQGTDVPEGVTARAI